MGVGKRACVCAAPPLIYPPVTRWRRGDGASSPAFARSGNIAGSDPRAFPAPRSNHNHNLFGSQRRTCAGLRSWRYGILSWLCGPNCVLYILSLLTMLSTNTLFFWLRYQSRTCTSDHWQQRREVVQGSSLHIRSSGLGSLLCSPRAGLILAPEHSMAISSTVTTPKLHGLLLMISVPTSSRLSHANRDLLILDYLGEVPCSKCLAEDAHLSIPLSRIIDQSVPSFSLSK